MRKNSSSLTTDGKTMELESYGVSGLTGHPAWNKGKKGVYKHSEETRHKISNRNKGQAPTYGMLGKRHSEGAKLKASEAMTAARKLKKWSRTKDLTGKIFGRLKVREQRGRDSCGNVVWSCECECGNRVEVVSRSLLSGATKSCRKRGHSLKLDANRLF